jgi:pimeloyl-ACP methyl ester carboxylesterase
MNVMGTRLRGWLLGLLWAFLVAAVGFTPNAHAARLSGPPGVVLVPGFFNSLVLGYARENRNSSVDVEPYFSGTIINTIEARGLPVAVVDNLEPVGSIKKNGALLLSYLRRLVETPKFQGRPLILVAHSAGGLYSLDALTQAPELPVQTLVTIGTPYNGVEVVDELSGWPFLKDFVRFIRLESLLQLRPREVGEFLKTVRVPTSVRLIATGGTQPSCGIIQCDAAAKLSWPLSLAQLLMSEPSDGIITQSSAFAMNVHLTSTSLTAVTIERLAPLRYDLEHWEQVQDYRTFSLLGTHDIETIDRAQREYFTRLMSFLVPSIASH